ncbi:MAG: hypothetical protein PHP61_06025 [Candidatus Izemoplasmatales bacterium]|jgi:phosphoglucosamine mutase|nr:hypothetical protein [Candidatus Izemoplasmatales bacterium]MDD4355437.1 hypothetical protein [Candidatus Izemoplasmatales bacterium]MDD4988394.1 hypothetical protein [Candidatus Izemoplasmatales bacterium]MDY0373323.1 hypothetical protein [Candidatus Izemoplasmatales bacterium]NLF49175.1 phosphoglucosamine mutase [Acholeplasmataceae bacterium]
MGKYFGTDGIRGIAYDFLTSELATAIGRSLVVLQNRKMVIARDTRESGPMLVEALKKGAIAVGINCVDYGVLPTPLLSYLSKIKNSIGVMVTASHNPFQDNGIKVFNAGHKLLPNEESMIESEIDVPADLSKIHKSGSPLPADDPIQQYRTLFRSFSITKRLRIGADLAHGATTATAPAILAEAASELFLIGNHPDGININEHVGSTHPEALQELVKKHHLDVGFAFDGDGDRVLACDGQGVLFDGDMLLYIIACFLQKEGKLHANQVVLTRMSNLGIIKALKKQGIDTLFADVGDKYVLEALENHQLTLGGENSGHIINRLLLDTGDGVLNAMQIIDVLVKTGKTLSQLTEDVVFFPDKLYNLRGVDRMLAKHPEVIRKVKEIETRLNGDGKVLVRPSGTEPLIRIAVSAPSEAIVDQIIAEIIATIDTFSKNK